MNNNAKQWLYAFLGLVVGALTTYVILQPSADTVSDEARPEGNVQTANEQLADTAYFTFNTKGVGLVPPLAQGIRAATAFQWFKNFQGNNPSSPRGTIRTVDDMDNDQAALGMYLDKNDLFQQLDSTAANQSKTLTGYYMIYAQEGIRQHRVLFMGVYKDGNGDQRLMLPVNGSDQTAIFDWIRPCPEFCPKEAAGSSLWTLQNWMQ